MASLFDSIGEFLASLFGSSPEFQLKRDLRKLEDQVTIYQPPIYQSQGQKVLPALAVSLAHAQKIFAPIAELFSRTISHPEPRLAEAQLYYLVENLLEGDIYNRRVSLGYDNLKTRLLTTDDTLAEIGAINGDFARLSQDIRRQDHPALLLPLDRLYRLAGWVNHPIGDFLSLFKAPPGMGQEGQSVSGEAILAQLLDIYYVLCPVEIDEHLETGLSLLFERVSPQKAQENLASSRRILDKARIIFQGACHPEHLAVLIKVLQGDPSLEPAWDKQPRNFLEEYLRTSSERFERDRNRATGEVQESNLEQEIHRLFQDRPLLSVSGYDQEHNTDLTKAGLNRFSLVKPMNILRSFLVYHLESSLYPSVERVLADAVYQEKGWGQTFGNTFYRCKEMGQRFLDFEHDLQEGEGRATLTTLEKNVKRPQGGPNAAPANRLVEIINKTADAFLQAEAKNLYLLAETLLLILQDYKRPTPEHIANIRIVGGRHNKQTIQDIHEGIQGIILLLGILKNFVVLTFGFAKHREP